MVWVDGPRRLLIPRGSSAGSTRMTPERDTGWRSRSLASTYVTWAAVWPNGGVVAPRLSMPPGFMHNQPKPSTRRRMIRRGWPWFSAPISGPKAHPGLFFPLPRASSLSTDPRLRILIAEVQSRCGTLFAAADATPHEEAMTQRSARLALRLMETERASLSQYRLLHALATADPFESPDDWANHAGMLWSAEPEVTAARVVWNSRPGEVGQVIEASRLNHGVPSK